MYEFELGDYVYGEDWCFGQIVKLEEDGVWVEFFTGDDWATWVFDYDQVRYADDLTGGEMYK